MRGPLAALAYLKDSLRGQHPRHAGHNPAGALAIVGLLVLIGLTAATGWAAFNDAGGHFVEELHEAMANALLLLVGVHLAGVAVSSWLHRDNLVGAMIHGRKRAPGHAGIRGSLRTVGALVFAAVVGFWWLQWDGPTGTIAHAARASASAMHDPDHD